MHAMSRQRCIITIALVVSLIFVGLLSLRVRRDRLAVQGPIYTVSQVEEGLDHHPAAWVGQVVRVRAVLVAGTSTCPATAACPPHPINLLVANLSETLFSALEIQVGAEESWLQALQRVPLISALLPPKPSIGAAGVYQIQLERVSLGFTCFIGRCYRGILLGSSPAAPS